MDLDEVKVCLRALLSSNPMSYSLKSLLNDFKSTTGCNLPLFGHADPLQFLKSLEDTVQLQGDPSSPEVALVESKKSAHIISLVDRQKVNEKVKSKNPYVIAAQRRQLVPPNSTGMLDSSKESSYSCPGLPTFSQARDGELKITMVTPMNFRNIQYNIARQSEPRSVLQLPQTNFGGSLQFQPKSQLDNFARQQEPRPALQLPQTNLRGSLQFQPNSSLDYIARCSGPGAVLRLPQPNFGGCLQPQPKSPLDYVTRQSVLQLPQTRGCLQPQQRPPLAVKNAATTQPLAGAKTKKTSHNKSITSPPSPDKQQVEKTLCESHERKKTDGCFFEDVSENDNCQSIEVKGGGTSPPALPSSNGTINDGMKSKLTKLIKNHPGGLWCCELPEVFYEEFRFVLDYREFGYTSLIQMLSELPDVFRCVRPGNEDWILFDASVPPTAEERKILEFQMRGDVMADMKANVQKLLSKSCETCSLGVELDKVADLYQKMFGTALDFESVGFKDVRSLLEIWEGSFLYIINVGGRFYCGPAFSKSVQSPVRWEEALPPITAENDIFLDIFPKEVVGPEESLAELDLTRHIAVGHVVEVCVAEVWSPGKFFVQLNKFKNRLNRFMDDLQKFYTLHLSKYKMPDSTIRANQVCIGLYSADPEFPDEWHRAQILKVINDKTVLVNFVDYGTVTRVKKTQLRFLHRSFQSFPVQAFRAQLSGVAPPNREGIWPMTTSKKFLQLLRVPYLNAEMVDIDFKKRSLSVILFDPFQKARPNVNKKLVQEKLARVAEPLRRRDPTPEVPPPPVVETRQPGEKSSNALVEANERFSKNVPEITDQFSDIDDLSQSTLFQFKMKSFAPESSREKSEAPKNVDPSNVSYEFDEIPELRKSHEETKQGIPQGVVGVAESQLEPIASPENPHEQKREKLTSLTRQQVPEENSQQKTSRSDTAPIKPKPLPPGLEHVNPLPFLLQPEDLKRKINILALDLLTRNDSIKQVGVNDPALALKIATEMAEAYVSSEVSMTLPVCCNYYPPFPSPFPGDKEPELPAESQPPETARQNGHDFKCGDTCVFTAAEVRRSPMVESKEYVEETQIGGNILHLIKVDEEVYLCAEEVVRQFTVFSSREIADRVLQTKKFPTEYRVISKKSDEKVLRALKSRELPSAVKKKSKRLKVYLLRVGKVLPYLRALGCRTEAFEEDFLELQKVWERKKSQTMEPS